MTIRTQGVLRTYFLYWGKAKPARDAGAQYHLLAYHCLDVAAVGLLYLRQSPSLHRLLHQVLQCDDDAKLENWLVFWLILHDLGKFSEAFQSQRPDLFEQLRGRRSDPAKPYIRRHDTLGMLCWKQLLEDRAFDECWFGPDTALMEDGLGYWARAVTGHHGMPPQEDGSWRQHSHNIEDREAVLEFVSDVRSLAFGELEDVLPGPSDPEAFEYASKDLSWWIAGITVLADWLGSNTNYFAYRANPDAPTPLSDYWQHAQRQAQIALDAAGVLSQRPVEPLDFNALFPGIANPSPLQGWAAEVEISDGPQIYMLEDVTGAGKTEAAILLAHRLMATGQADGFFIGLPTMATANAMYSRIAQVYARLFEGDASLALAHGQRNLVEEFAKSVFPDGPVDSDARQLDETASSRCSAWLADHNKRALMAPAGVGTLDQALLAVLHSKHQSLRLLGLFRKVLIVDEVHACDAYMQGILENLLTFHARAGGSVILLSATLPQRMKNALLAAFAEGCQQAAPLFTNQCYPLVSAWQSTTPETARETPLATREDVRRRVAVDYVSDQANVVARIEDALDAGRCVCWIRNTVADALEAYGIFEGKLPAEKLILFHARFALQDRLRIETQVLACFGKESTPADRTGRLVIATQVVEQSLDADWDLVVSDLAPIDRLIQRAGRLHRHPRDENGQRLKDPIACDQRGEPRLCVFGPAWQAAPPADWFKAVFRRAANVYAHHGQLWLTARALQVGHFAMPDDARELIESVFGEDAETPEALQHNANQAEGKAYGDASEAQQNTVKLAHGYVRGGIDWWSEAKTPSRLGEASMNVVLARWQDDRLLPWCSHEKLRHAWAYSTVRVAERLIARTAEPDSPARKNALDEALLTLPGKGQWCVVLALEPDRQGGSGQAWSKATDRKPEQLLNWHYDVESGLTQIDTSKEDE